MNSQPGWRDLATRLGLLFLLAIGVITEVLSAFGSFQPRGVLAGWAVAVGLIGWFTVQRYRRQRLRAWQSLDWIVALAGAACVAIATGTFVTAIHSPPNSADALAYHMPRVIYWAQQESVRFFPTPYLNQIMLQPFAEYAMANLYLLTGGDQWINLVQWFASLASMVLVSLLAREWGVSGWGQALAALLCATIPSGVLASSGAKNDYVLAMLIAAAVYFAHRFAKTLELEDGAFLGIAIGLALLTKGTAYLFAPWPVAAALTRVRWDRRLFSGLCLAAVVAAMLNVPHYARNLDLSGSILGFDSAQGDGMFRWRNESFGWKQTTSNLLRNASEQLGSRSVWWNGAVFNAVISTHQALGMDPNDPVTTWRWAKFEAPRNANHEADSPNRVHLFLTAIAVCLIWWRAKSAPRGTEILRVAGYAASLLVALVVFCAYLKWQPFLSRLFLPLFVLATPLTPYAIELGVRARWLKLFVPIAAGWLALDSARLPVLENWVRPLTGTRSVLRVPYEDQYFFDMAQWHNADSYRAVVHQIAGSTCRTIGIDATNLQIEYPLMALLRRRDPAFRFLHTEVDNVSSKYAVPATGAPCAVVCLDCAGDTSRLDRYSARFPAREQSGKLVLLTGR